MFKVSLLLLAILGSMNCAAPKIDVFVESLCPDCEDFIGGSFRHFLDNPELSSLATITFYPYGNAHEKQNGDNWEFTCQHGENECYGNTVEVCGLNNMNALEGQNFMVCMESNIKSNNKNINKALDACVEDQDLFKTILKCALGKEGNELQHSIALQTPDHKYVPWIQFNGVHDNNVEGKILDNLSKFVCSLGDNNQLDACKNIRQKSVLYTNFNSMTQRCLNKFMYQDDSKFLE